jgi:two-component system cell cycle response regulator
MNALSLAQKSDDNGSQGPSRLILAVDDDQDNLTMVSRTLEYEGFRVEQASSGEEALEKLKKISPDLVLLDINMPGLSGLDTLKRLRLRDQYVSVIFVSARNETSDVVKGLDAGADDYVCKPFEPLELLARVRAQLRIKDLNDRLSAANTRLQELVDIDDLTGLFNMRSIYPRIDTEVSRAKRFNRHVGIVMLDMDDFKNVNDQHDHLFGSFVLGEVGKIIQDNIRSVDFAARYGGDEFLVGLSETTPEGALRFSERLRAVIEAYDFTNKVSSMRLTVSIGISVCPPTMSAIEAKNLVRYADQALYEAKRAGKNCVRTFDMASLLLKKTS